jgi:hypothetical protein
MTKFPVNFPVGREAGPETGSIPTGTSATQTCYWRVGRLYGKVLKFWALACLSPVSGLLVYEFSDRNKLNFAAHSQFGFFEFPFLHPEAEQRTRALVHRPLHGK